MDQLRSSDSLHLDDHLWMQQLDIARIELLGRVQVSVESAKSAEETFVKIGSYKADMLPAAAKWLAKIAQRTQTWVDDMITPEKCRQIIDAAIEPMVNLREGGTVDSLLKKADELDKHADAMYLNASLIGMPQAADAAVVDVLQRAQRILESIQADMLLK